MAETMQAGRELDARVAEKVMGWADFDHDVPRYSTDTTAALTVLDALGGIVRITRLRPDEWHVQIGEGSTRWGETLPLAICRAVLAAVESPHAG
ncbi:MAG: BC1872 family protein [Gemmatimonadaceae bacterium]